MLTSRAAVKVSMRIAATDTSKDAVIDSLIGAVDSLIKQWCGRNLEKVLACSAPTGVAVTSAAGGSLTSGQAYYWKITSLNLNGESTGSSEVSLTPTGTNLTAALSWGQVTAATGYKIYRGTSSGGQDKLVGTVQAGSVVSFNDTGVTGDSGTVPSTSTATAGIVEYPEANGTALFRLINTPIKVSELTSVYHDPTANFGRASGAFASGTLMTEGTDYVLQVDQPDGVTSRSGLVERIKGYWPGRTEYTRGRLSHMSRPYRGGIKASHGGGYAPGAVPAEISNQANLMIARLLKIGASGFVTTSESFEDRSVSIDLGPFHSMLFTPDVVAALIPYRCLRP